MGSKVEPEIGEYTWKFRLLNLFEDIDQGSDGYRKKIGAKLNMDKIKISEKANSKKLKNAIVKMLTN